MWDIIKIILYALFAILLTIATALVAFITWTLIIASPILIPIIIVFSVIGVFLGYLIVKK